jgi:uncharacterized protein (TIGR03067 family)
MKHLLVVVVAGLLVAGQDKKDNAVKEELKKLEGTWVVESASRDGKDATGGGPSELVISGNSITMKEATKDRKGKITIDPTKNPKTIDVEPEEKKETSPAIYELTGDTLKLCIGRPGKDRPTEFSDTGHVLVTLKRKKS